MGQKNTTITQHKSQTKTPTPQTKISQTETPKNHNGMVITVLGMDIGKSCFLHQFCNGGFISSLEGTVGAKIWQKSIEINSQQVNLMIWDVAKYVDRWKSLEWIVSSV
jgi:GTPase SAR1 family protein